jgi:hypothetical protein
MIEEFSPFIADLIGLCELAPGRSVKVALP